MKRTIYNRILPILISAILAVISISGCGQAGNTEPANTSNSSTADTETAVGIAETILSETEEADDSSEDLTQSSVSPPSVPSDHKASYDWHDHVGNLDTFVYGLLMNEYQLAYKTFNAVIVLPDETEVFGIGYTDYSEYYERADGKGGYFPAGFLALIGEPEIPEDEIDNGIEIINLDNEESKYQFVYAYHMDPYMEHCVIWDQYLRYGIDENQHITYETQKYERGVCEEELGTLYSFDEKRVVFEPDVGDYQYISGTSLYGTIDYEEVQAEVNRILEEQEYNFADVEVETVIYEAKDAMRSYLLSMQEETFMGCSVKEMLRISETLDPKECIQFTDDGLVFVDMTSTPPKEPEALTKWLTGICCGTAIITCAGVSIFVPALAPVSGAISGAAVEVLMEVVAQNRDISDVNWGKVAVAAATGALLAWGCPMMAAGATKGAVNVLGQRLTAEMATQLGKLAGYGILTLSNAVVTGSASAAYTVLDGGTKEEAIDAFRIGAAIGAACTAATIIVANAAGAGMNALTKSHPNNWLSKAASKAGAFVKGHQIHPFDEKIESVLIPKSINEAAEAAGYQLKLLDTNDKQLIVNVDQLPSSTNENFVIVDDNGNVLTKADLRKNGGNGRIILRDSCDQEIRNIFENEYKVTELRIQNGVPDFEPISQYHTNVTITPNRTDNFNETYKTLANEWSETPSKIPDRFREEMTRRQITELDLDDRIVRDILSDLKWTVHEGLDNTIYLVERTVHSRLSHAGGVAYAAALEAIEIGTMFFKELHDSVATGITGTLIIQGAQALK